MPNQKNLFTLWSPDGLPARLTPERTAEVLGFAPHEIPILVKAKLLTPLGNPAKNAPKYFAAVEVATRAEEIGWLNKASRATTQHWASKRRRRQALASRKPEIDAESGNRNVDGGGQ